MKKINYDVPMKARVAALPIKHHPILFSINSLLLTTLGELDTDASFDPIFVVKNHQKGSFIQKMHV